MEQKFSRSLITIVTTCLPFTHNHFSQRVLQNILHNCRLKENFSHKVRQLYIYNITSEWRQLRDLWCGSVTWELECRYDLSAKRGWQLQFGSFYSCFERWRHFSFLDDRGLKSEATVTIVGNRRFRVGCSTIGNSVALWEFKLRYTGLSQLSIRFDRFSFIDTAWGRTSAYQRRVHLTRTPLLHVKGIEGRVSVFCAFETMTFSLNIDCRNFQMWSSFGLLGGHYNPSMNVMLYVLSFSCG